MTSHLASAAASAVLWEIPPQPKGGLLQVRQIQLGGAVGMG